MKIHHFTLTLATVLFAGVLQAQPVNPASAANPLLAPKPVDTTPRLAYGQMMKQGEKPSSRPVATKVTPSCRTFRLTSS
ncbi:MAG: hypothetical protein IPP59_06180 [Betaproteobacteria bacterium]|nr:hypothetical protein [Candidatus Dechloromonas phosphorivorans]